jgi:hypothetical protein
MTVYKRNRKETATQYVVTAQALQKAVVQYVMNEKYVPKKWRFVLAQGAINLVCEIMNNIIAAHNTFPNTEEKLTIRKEYLRKAYVGCYQLQQHLICLINVIPTVKAGNLGEITGLLLDEIALIVKTGKSAHLVQQQE